ncbi:hypothetical protein JHK87_030073 [Glycine soja]|nr:hypothetical protein JHK87_030073 [Glycine soja]
MLIDYLFNFALHIILSKTNYLPTNTPLHLFTYAPKGNPNLLLREKVGRVAHLAAPGFGVGKTASLSAEAWAHNRFNNNNAAERQIYP